MNNIHIGSIIKKIVEERQLSISNFAFHINRTRSTVYDIFTRKSIDIDLLLEISEALNYNFLEEYIDQQNLKKENKIFLAIEIDEDKLLENNLLSTVHFLKELTDKK